MIRIGRGSIVVEYPSQELMSGLSRFRHGSDGSGEYEELYTLSREHHSLVTMPGFAERVIGLCPEDAVKDERVPMPEPDVEKALEGVDAVWHGVVKDALLAGGGVVAIPEIFGITGFASAIARAFHKDRLAERGTPHLVVAARDREDARRICFSMRKILPDRNVGLGDCASDDVLVAPYGSLGAYPMKEVGILIGDVTFDEKSMVKRARDISVFRNAARWGIYETACGGLPCELDLAAEGLFGPLCSSATYQNAVDASIAAPVTVCWLKSPRPNARWGSAPFKILSSIAMCDTFFGVVNEIARRTPVDIGCVVCSDDQIQKKIADMIRGPGVTVVNKRVPVKDLRIAFDNIAGGNSSIVLSTWECFPPATSQNVMVSVTCGGREFAGKKFPWTTNKGKVYLVDFSHDWDVHNGRPGMLARNDEARRRRYTEIGFSQISVPDVNHLPFIG